MSNDGAGREGSHDGRGRSSDVAHDSEAESSAMIEELEVLKKMRLALGATLHMLECARDDLVALGERMDRLRVASERCRAALRGRKDAQDETQDLTD